MKTKIIIAVSSMILIISIISSYYVFKNIYLHKEKQKEIEVIAPTIEIIEKDTKEDVLISFAGDCTIGSDDKFTYNTLPQVLKQNNNDYSYLFKNVKNIFVKDDLTVVNLETTFTNSNNKLPKGNPPFYNFKGDPEYAKSLSLGSIQVVNIANNHIKDYKEEGYTDTINTLKSNNINYFGEGNKYITEIKGVKFGFLGYMSYSASNEFLSKMKKDIEDLKSQNCIVIISFHWGIEREYSPNSVQKNLAHFAIDKGADLIIGHHPHVVQGIEKYKDKFICYSLGNFCFGGNSNPSDKDSFIFQIKYSFKNNNLTGYGIKVIPCSISSKSNTNDYCPTPLDGAKKSALLTKITTLSPDLKLNLNEDFSYIYINN